MKTFIIILSIALLAGLTGCSGNRDRYEKLGIDGQHAVVQTTEINQLTGQMFGSFFLGCGTVSGNIKGEEVIAFTWSPKVDQFVMTTVSKSKIIIMIDSSKETPTVEFVINEQWLDDPLLRLNRRWFDVVANNINQLMESDAVDVVRVRLTKEQLKQETCLPQP